MLTTTKHPAVIAPHADGPQAATNVEESIGYFFFLPQLKSLWFGVFIILPSPDRIFPLMHWKQQSTGMHFVGGDLTASRMS